MLAHLPRNSTGVHQSLQGAQLLLRDIGRNVQVDTTTDAVRRGTFGGMRRHCAFSTITASRRDPESIVDTDPRDPKHFIDCLDITLHVRLDVLSRRRNVAHLQCACQGPEQSTTDGANHVVKRGWHIFFRLDTVKLLDPTMDAESNRFIEAFKIRVA